MKTDGPRTLLPDVELVTYVLDIIVVTYRSWKSASNELTMMVELAKSFEEARWTFVDNSPDGGDSERLWEISDGLRNVRILSCRDNPGFAGGCNTAASKADSEWLFFLNPDITLQPWQLQRLLAAVPKMSKADAIAVSQITHGICHSGVGVTKYLWFVDRPNNSKMRLLGPSGGAGIFKRSTFLRMGGFYEPLFAWGEDADLAMRLSKAGSKCVELDLKLQHQGQHSVSAGRESRSFKARLLARNRIWIAKRNLSWAGYVGFVLLSALLHALQTPRNVHRGTFAPTWRGYVEGLLGVGRSVVPGRDSNPRDGVQTADVS